MNYSVMTERETEIELNTSVGEGLSSFTAHDKLISKGRNLPEKAYSKSAAGLVFSQLKNLYTIAFLTMGIITAILDFKESLWAWIIFFAVAVINMVSGFLRDNKERKNAIKFDNKRADEVMVLRDGKVTAIDPTLLVVGDIVVLEKGSFVPADLRVLEYENLKADESVFGEVFVAVNKYSERMEEDAGFFRCNNILYTGSQIAQGRGKGVVIATGKDTAIAKVNALKKKKLSIQKKYAKSATSEKILVLGAIIIAMVVLVYLSLTAKDVKNALLGAFAISLCVLPAPVAMVRWLAGKYFLYRLKNMGITFKNNEKLEDLSEADYLLFDKGGILTDGSLVVEETLIPDSEKLEMAVLCSDCEIKNEKLTGSNIDLATLSEAKARGIDVNKLLKETKRVLYMPYDEARKIMAVLIETDGGYRLIVKGAIDTVPTLCDYISDGENQLEITGEILHKLENASSAMAEKGLKIRAVAYRDIESIPENIEDEIKGLTFVGVLGFRELIVKKSKDAVRKIESMFVRAIMVTGDNTITAASIGKLAGLIKKESECISFRDLAECSDSELIEACGKYKIISEASREDRIRLVKALSKAGNKVSVAGEQMSEGSVSLFADCTITREDKNGDVFIKEENISSVEKVVYEARAMRGNKTYASLLGISLGMAEALFLLWMMFSEKAVVVKSADMLLLNLFIVCVPCIVLSLFARVRQKHSDMSMLMLRCGLQAFICTLFALCAKEDFMVYFAIYSLLESGRVCASFKNLEKGTEGGKGLILVLVMTFLVIVLAKSGLWGIFTTENLGLTVLFAAVAVAINAILSNIRLKGFGAKNV